MHCKMYSPLPITQTLCNLQPKSIPLDFLHTFTVTLPSVTRTIDSLNLPLTQK